MEKYYSIWGILMFVSMGVLMILELFDESKGDMWKIRALFGLVICIVIVLRSMYTLWILRKSKEP